MPFPPSAPLTAAQISRAASQTVRLAFYNRESRNAYYVVNSLRHSQYRDRPLDELPRAMRRGFTPIDFGQKVSHRLAAHCLLHGLVRAGLTMKAAKEAQLLMMDGVQIRSTTLEAVFYGLTTTASIPDARPELARMLTPAMALQLQPSAIADPCTRYAVRLLMLARGYRQYRSDRMFKSVVDATLLQGHIIFASLLIAYLIKDWQTHNARMALTEAADGPAEDAAVESKTTRSPRKSRNDSPSPSPASMLAVLARIQATFDDPNLAPSDPSLLAAVQALAHLAALIEDRSLPFSSIGPLLRAMYSCPRIGDAAVFIRDRNGKRRVHAYDYFHRILLDLANSPPTKRHAQSTTDPPSMLPPLDVKSYNSLLHYALRHRLDPALADRILRHMTKERVATLQPDNTTYNILLRSGSLIRRNDIADQSIRRLSKTEANEDWFVDYGNAVVPQDVGVHPIGRSQFSGTLEMLLKSPFEMPATRRGFHLADAFTISSYITHLVSTGNPHLVATILFRLLPELHVIDHPSWADIPREQRAALLKVSRRQSLERAVGYGPFFFAAVLNALQKAGKTGLAERVWLLGKEAERASWVLATADGDVRPWCLSIHSYTSMMQCYANEARKGLDVFRESRGASNGYARAWMGDRGWSPTSRTHVKGWARLVVESNGIQPSELSRRDGAQRMATLLLRSMHSGARAVYRALQAIGESGASGRAVRRATQGLQVPAADARFYNAALDLFARQRVVRRSRRDSRARWRRRLRFCLQRYAERGELFKEHHPMAEELAEHMTYSGFSVPDGVKAMLVGKWSPETEEGLRPAVRVRTPYAFPSLHSTPYKPRALPTYKSKGLPLGNPRRRSHRRTRMSSNPS